MRAFDCCGNIPNQQDGYLILLFTNDEAEERRKEQSTN